MNSVWVMLDNEGHLYGVYETESAVMEQMHKMALHSIKDNENHISGYDGNYKFCFAKRAEIKS